MEGLSRIHISMMLKTKVLVFQVLSFKDLSKGQNFANLVRDFEANLDGDIVPTNGALELV